MDKKYLVDLIQKRAQIPQLQKSRVSGPTNSNTTKDNSSSGAASLFNPSSQKSQNFSSVPNYVPQISQAIKEMQTNIRDVANSVMQNTFSVKALNDFIAEQYLDSLDPDKKGNELKSAPNTKTRIQTDTYEIDVVMQNLYQLAQDKIKINGVWDSVTDNLLRNIAGLTYALLQMEGDFRLKNQNFTSKNLNRFYQELSNYSFNKNKISLSPAQQDQKAKIISTLLKGIKNLYNSFRYQIQSRPEFRSLIENKKPLDKYTDEVSSKLDKTEEELLDNPYTIFSIQDRDPTGKIINFTIPVSALINKNSFKEFMSKYNITKDQDLTNYLQSFIKKLNGI
jgi:predicted amino acid-binding ACT domain protein